MTKTQSTRKDAYVYMLSCADGSLYTGWTYDPEKRLSRHNAGTASKYTRARRPVQRVYLRRFATKEEAMREEARIKRLTRADKLLLIRQNDSVS